jgi:hypothetical protein
MRGLFREPHRVVLRDFVICRGNVRRSRFFLPARYGPAALKVIADGVVVGRIMLFSATPVELPLDVDHSPWVRGDRSPTHGHAATLEAATQAFAKSWHRERRNAEQSHQRYGRWDWEWISAADSDSNY